MQRLLQFIRQPTTLIFLVLFVDSLGLAITMPIFPLYAERQLGATPIQITGAVSAFFSMSFLAGPVLGRLSDRIGRRPVLVLSQFGSLLNFVLIAIAPNIWWLYAGRIVDGITAGNVSVAMAYISDVSEKQERAKRLGTAALGWALGLSIGPFFGSQIAAVAGPRAAYAAGACTAMLTILITSMFLKESLPSERRTVAARAATGGSVWSLIRNPVIRTLLLVFFLDTFAGMAYSVIFVLWTAKVVLPTTPQADVSRIVSYVLALMGGVGILVQLRLIGPLVRRFGERSLLITGIASRLAFYTMITFVPTLEMLFFGSMFMAFGFALLSPNVAALHTFAAGDRRGQVLGLNQSAGALGSIFGPLAAGFLFSQVSPGSPMIMAAIVGALAFTASLSLLRMKIEQPGMRPAE